MLLHEVREYDDFDSTTKALDSGWQFNLNDCEAVGGTGRTESL